MVYLVDDDIDDLLMIQEALERNNFNGRIVSARNGADFINKLHQSSLPELVVLDLNMPLKSGFEVLADLRSSKDLSSIPVVILTASNNKQDEIKCKELGSTLFLQKPSTLDGYDAIASMILECIQNSQVKE
jgi:CheY-like chemotaxis protein